MPTKPKKGVKRKADTTTPVITTVAGVIPQPSTPDHEHLSENYNLNEASFDGPDIPGRVTSRTPSNLLARRESIRTIRPPRSKDLDSEENVIAFYHFLRKYLFI